MPVSLKVFLIIASLTAFGVAAYSCAACATARKGAHSDDHDSETGVVHGAEAITIAPAEGSEQTPRTAVLLVHGFLGARSDFADLGERLAEKGFTVRLMRLPGHGTTPSDFAHLPDGALYKGVLEEYRALRGEFDRVYVAGFSMGGTLSTLLTAREQTVDRLVLIAPYYRVTYQWFYGLPPATWNALLGWAIPYLPKTDTFVKLNDRTFQDRIFMYRAVPTSGVRQLVGLGREAFRPEVLEQVRCPVLVLQSEGDEASSPEATREAYEGFASEEKELVWFTRSNHILLWDYDREDAKRAIIDFLAGGGSGGE